MDNIYVIVDGELYHHGIKGMKWGRRRFQNKDGSLTPAGEKRYNDSDGGSALDRWKANREAKRAAKAKAKSESDAAKKVESEENAYRKKQVEGMSDDGINKAIARSQLEERYNQQVRSKDAKEGSYRNKSVKDMTDEELAKAIERSRMEQTYNQLNPQKVSAGKQFISTMANDVAKPVLIESGKQFINKLGDALLKKYFPEAEKIDIGEEIKKVKLESDLFDLNEKKARKAKEEADQTSQKETKKIVKDDDPDDNGGRPSGSTLDIDDRTSSWKKVDKNTSGHAGRKSSNDNSDDEYERIRKSVDEHKANTDRLRADQRRIADEKKWLEKQAAENAKAQIDKDRVRKFDAVSDALASKDPIDTILGTGSTYNITTSAGKKTVTSILDSKSSSTTPSSDFGSFKAVSSRAKSLQNSGKTIPEIAKELGVSETMAKVYLYEKPKR